MRRIFTFLLAMASFTSLLADDIQFTNLPYTHYGDSVRVSANTSLSDLPMPTNYEYGFEYEYKSTDGESGGGGVEPCAITNYVPLNVCAIDIGQYPTDANLFQHF